MKIRLLYPSILARAFIFALFATIPTTSRAQCDTLRVKAVGDTLAVSALGDTLTVKAQRDTIIVIVQREPLAPLAAQSHLLTDSASLTPAKGKRTVMGKIADASMLVLKDCRIKGGQNIGATAPFGLPEGSTVLSFSPIFAPSIAIERQFTLYRWLYALTGVRFEYKGMKTRAGVQHFETEVAQEMDGRILVFGGNFTGENVTRVVSSYISIPLRVGFQITRNYAIEAGGFVAFAMTRGFSGKVENGYLWTKPTETDPSSSKIPIESADYSFDDNERKVDAGVELYGSHHLGANILLDAGLGVGLIPIFDREKFKGMPFSMYNIYLNIAVGYKFN